MSEYPVDWDELSDIDRIRYWAAQGDVASVLSMYGDGALDGLPEAEQRKIVAESFDRAAGQTSRDGGDPFNQLATAIEIRNNVHDIPLKEHIKELLTAA